MMEGPSLQAAVGRLADAQLNLAAWGLTMSLSLLVESPVIMLLATTIALCRSRQAFEALRRYVLGLCAACTLLAAVLAFTPLYSLVTRALMGQPEAIAAATRPALGIMLLWTAAIGYRRFYQGVLVRAAQTVRVSWGTAVRLLSVAITAVTLVQARVLPGVQLAAVAIMAGVISEAVATRLFAVGATRAIAPPLEGSPPLTRADITRFHAPLAATTLMTLTAPPLTALALARLPHPEQTLAAWPVAFSVLFVIRGGAMALQEIAVACGHDPRARASLARFTWIVGSLCSLAAVALAFTPLLHVYLATALRVPDALHEGVGRAIAISSALPLLTAVSSWMRGLLMAERATPAVYAGMGVALGTQIALLLAAVVLGGNGIDTAAGATTGAALAECVYLRVRLRDLSFSAGA